MKILLFHPALLPPADYGGVERVVLWLARGLVERGHEVHVAALRGSRLPGGARLIEMDRPATSAADLLAAIPRAIAGGLDVIHFQAPPEPEIWERLPCAAMLTVHGNGQPGEVFPHNTVFLSQDHARRHRAVFYIHNGIDPAEYEFGMAPKGDWYLFLSKTSWSVKNLAGAMRVCRKARARLKISGGSRPFLRRLEACMSPRTEWVGPVHGKRKAELLAGARALVFPVLWPEPFGLVVAEALMSGTPVIASARGSLPELVPKDVGALLSVEAPDAEWAHWLSRTELPFQPERCREWAMEKFHYLRMAGAYEDAYRKALRGEPLQPQRPVAADWRMQ